MFSALGHVNELNKQKSVPQRAYILIGMGESPWHFSQCLCLCLSFCRGRVGKNRWDLSYIHFELPCRAVIWGGKGYCRFEIIHNCLASFFFNSLLFSLVWMAVSHQDYDPSFTLTDELRVWGIIWSTFYKPMCQLIQSWTRKSALNGGLPFHTHKTHPCHVNSCQSPHWESGCSVQSEDTDLRE